MKNKTSIVTTLSVLAILACANAYAAGDCALTNAVGDFFAGVGGALYNALPWNWGSWMGK